jgi:ankyrin repeat protein
MDFPTGGGGAPASSVASFRPPRRRVSVVQRDRTPCQNHTDILSQYDFDSEDGPTSAQAVILDFDAYAVKYIGYVHSRGLHNCRAVPAFTTCISKEVLARAENGTMGYAKRFCKWVPVQGLTRFINHLGVENDTGSGGTCDPDEVYIKLLTPTAIYLKNWRLSRRVIYSRHVTRLRLTYAYTVDIGSPATYDHYATSNGKPGRVFTAQVVDDDPVVVDIRNRTITAARRERRFQQQLSAGDDEGPGADAVWAAVVEQTLEVLNRYNDSSREALTAAAFQVFKITGDEEDLLDTLQRLARLAITAAAKDAIRADSVDDLISALRKSTEDRHERTMLGSSWARVQFDMVLYAAIRNKWKALVFLIFDCALDITNAYHEIELHAEQLAPLGDNEPFVSQLRATLEFFNEECGGVRLREQEAELLAASDSGDHEVVRRLLDTGVGVNHATFVENGNKWTALMAASYKGHTDIVVLLLAHEGVDVNQGRTDDGQTALMIASMVGHAGIVALLLAHEGVDVNQGTTADGMTALMIASYHVHADVVALLLAHEGVEVRTALMWARRADVVPGTPRVLARVAVVALIRAHERAAAAAVDALWRGDDIMVSVAGQQVELSMVTPDMEAMMTPEEYDEYFQLVDDGDENDRW